MKITNMKKYNKLNNIKYTSVKNTLENTEKLK